jgi:acetylornithine deacetylase
MKGFLACALAMVPVACHRPLKKPLWLAFSYDEEVGCLGVHSLLERLAARPIKPALCLVGEPTEMQPVYGHKGKVALRCTVKGHACHSAYTPEGVNAINYAARLITFILEQDRQLATLSDSHFSPPFSTLHVGTVSGGRALNIVPDHCQFDMELRYLPQSPPEPVLKSIQDYAQDQLLPEMQQRQPDTSITFTELAAYPGLFTPPETPWVKQFIDWTGHTQATTVAFGTEAGLFEHCEIPTIICGPGSMVQGHKPDEFITAPQLQQCLTLLEKVITYLCDE